MSDFKIVQLLNPIQINTNINPTGVYNAATTYGVGDSVSYGNSSYLCILATTGNVPTNTTYWQLLASSATNKLSTTARNQTGVTIPAGTVVYFSGVSGNVPTLALSQADTELGSTKTIGITATSIANNANGEVIIFGLADSLNTTAYTAGSALWLSPTVAGGLTMTKPSAPNHMVFIGFCTRSHPTDGTIEVKVQNGFELEELHNVAISSVADNQVLKYDAPNLLWKNETLVKGDVGLGNVPNVDATNPSNIVEDSTHRFVTDTEKTTWNGKQNALGFTPEDVANKDNGAISSSTTTYPTSGAVKTVTDLKANIASPTFTGTVTAPTLIVDSITGVLKATSGTVSSATAGTDYENPLTFSAPLSRLVNAVSIPDATTSVTGALTSTDWTTFNNKVSTSRNIATTSPLVGGGDLSADRTLSIPSATTSVNGYLTSTDWTKFNNKIGNTFESVSKNLRQYDYALNYSSGVLTTIVYTVPSVGTITKTLNYSSGVLTSVVLNGSTPASISLTKTLTYSSGVLTSIAYT